MFFRLLVFFIRAEWAHLEKFLSSLVLGINVLIIFVFSFGEIETHMKQNAFFVSMLGIAMLNSCQALLSRAWEQETQDDALEILSRAIDENLQLYFAKVLAEVGLLIVVNIPLLILAAILLPHGFELSQVIKIGYFVLLSLVGATCIGVLLSALVNHARSKNLLFTLIFFPLLTPVLVSFVFGALSLASNKPDFWQWFQLLGLFDMLYLTLGAALFCEIMETK